MYDLSNKTALVTGGTRGIGRAIAMRLYEAGAKVIITGNSAPSWSVEVKYEKVNFSKTEELLSFTKKMSHAKIDILINNAGINKIAKLENIELADFLNIQSVNLKAPFLLCQALVPGMLKAGFGRIVNIGSIFGRISKEYRTSYSASKFALEGITRSLALELASQNILINCVAPGFIDTELTREVLSKDQIDELSSQVPLNRLGKPEEVAELVLFLASVENTYCTGETILIDGGFTSC